MSGGEHIAVGHQQGMAELIGLDLNVYTVLSSKVSGGKRLTLYTDKDKVHGYVWIQPTSPFFELSYKELEETISDTGMAVSTERMRDLNAMLTTLQAAQQSGQFDPNAFQPFEVAVGKAPQHGQDGRFEWFITEPEPGKLRFEPDAHGRIDFREMNTVINVNLDDPLVKIHEPTRGEPGTDVFNRPIAATNGEFKRLAKGKGVRYEEEDHTMYAENGGHVQLKNGTLTVLDVYVVEGNVDFTIGNINFRGAVQVNKDICEGFTVRATDNVLVEGMTNQSSIFSGGDIEVRGGITGQAGSSIIEAKGKVVARYVVNTKIEAQGDVLVESQVVNCNITTAGRVLVPGGKVVGGTIVALGGIEVGEVGAELGTRTTLIISLDHFATTETRAIDNELDGLEKKLTKIEGLLGPYLKDRSLLNELPDARMKPILDQLKELEQLQERVATLHEERVNALAPFQDLIGEEIIIRKRIYPGVDVRIDTSRQVFAESIEGPIKLKPNYARGTISLHPV